MIIKLNSLRLSLEIFFLKTHAFYGDGEERRGENKCYL